MVTTIKKTISVDKYMEKREASYTVGRNLNCSSNYVKQNGVSSENQK